MEIKNKQTKQAHGEILMLLVKRSENKGKEIAPALGITPGYFSTLYKSKKIRVFLQKQIIKYFELDYNVFETGMTLDSEQSQVDIAILQETIKTQAAEIKRLIGIIDNLTKPKG